MLKNLLNDIKNISSKQPNIGLVHIGDVYELNENQQVEYPAIVITSQYNTLSIKSKQLNSTINIFAVERLTEDKSNEIDVKDWAISVLYTIVKELSKKYIINDQLTCNVFTERFGSVCAGAYITLQITTGVNECNRLDYEKE